MDFFFEPDRIPFSSYSDSLGFGLYILKYQLYHSTTLQQFSKIPDKQDNFIKLPKFTHYAALWHCVKTRALNSYAVITALNNELHNSSLRMRAIDKALLNISEICLVNVFIAFT
jgi:hypothetical protein